MSVPAADNLRYNADAILVPTKGRRLVSAMDMRAAADLLEAIDALPDDDPTHPDDPDVYWSGYRYAMRQVKALLHPEVQP
jgi:hypothetical protein